MRLKYLDVLKAIAIIAVVLYHSGFLTYGYLGVDLFLVINGYLITRGLSKKVLTTNEQHSSFKEYTEFELSHIIRLLPVLLVAGVFCMAWGYWVMLPDDYENLSESVVASNLFSNNILSAITTKNYWDISNEYKPLMHTWYLGVLMQFYIFYPLIFFIAKIDKKTPHKTLLTIISVMAIVSLLIYFGTSNIAHRFYYLPSRLFEFAVGGIVALTWQPQDEQRTFHKWFVYACYALLLGLLVLNKEIIPANIKLVLVVAISVALIISGESLENKVTANIALAKIGAASYSIFIWHQIFLAFYRYSLSSEFTVLGYLVFLVTVTIFSWLTYQYIEQKAKQWLDGKRSRNIFYVMTASVFVCLTAFASYIHMKGGVVRDVPELYISKNNKVDHKAYNDKIYKLDKPFETSKLHWLVIGNSFGRDFANVILESPVADSVEISYIHIDNDFKKPQYANRFAVADRVWLSTLGVDEKIITELELVCYAKGIPVENIVIVGEKNFGESNGQFYAHRNSPDYFNQRTKVRSKFIEKNNRLKKLYGDRYIDMLSYVIDDDGTVPVFTPDHHYFSQDCEHFSMGGAKWFAQRIDWNKYLQ